jgi:hypothetical protein
MAIGDGLGRRLRPAPARRARSLALALAAARARPSIAAGTHGPGVNLARISMCAELTVVHCIINDVAGRRG